MILGKHVRVYASICFKVLIKPGCEWSAVLFKSKQSVNKYIFSHSKVAETFEYENKSALKNLKKNFSIIWRLCFISCCVWRGSSPPALRRLFLPSYDLIYLCSLSQKDNRVIQLWRVVKTNEALVNDARRMSYELQ